MDIHYPDTDSTNNNMSSTVTMGDVLAVKWSSDGEEYVVDVLEVVSEDSNKLKCCLQFRDKIEGDNPRVVKMYKVMWRKLQTFSANAEEPPAKKKKTTPKEDQTGHTPVTEDMEELTLYLFPFREDMQMDKEFRLFVCQGVLTCISQQSPGKHNEWLASKTESEIRRVFETICTFFESQIKDKITRIKSYSVDFYFPDYFIEVNAFGKEYAAGSALFHWRIDEDLLLNRNGHIYCRYATND